VKHSRQAKPAAASRAKGSSSTADPKEVQALLVDIFALTGQKVEIDDPIVAAALIHSTLLRRARACSHYRRNSAMRAEVMKAANMMSFLS
jgi:hypothetical protein